MREIISKHRNKIIFVFFSTLTGFLTGKSTLLITRQDTPPSTENFFESKPENTTFLHTQLSGALPEMNTEYNGLCGAVIGLGFALLTLGMYYCADQKGKEIRRATNRLSDTLANIMRNIGLNNDKSDLQNFKRKAQFISGIPDFKIPDQYICPINKTIMIFPVTPLDGNSYEREALQQWYDNGKNTCPMVPSKQLENPRLLPINETLSKAIRLYVEECYKQTNKNNTFSSTQTQF
jgi:hypothetical protein